VPNIFITALLERMGRVPAFASGMRDGILHGAWFCLPSWWSRALSSAVWNKISLRKNLLALPTFPKITHVRFKVLLKELLPHLDRLRIFASTISLLLTGSPTPMCGR